MIKTKISLTNLCNDCRALPGKPDISFSSKVVGSSENKSKAQKIK
ncbi:MAG: hypothetical protein WCO06_04865 [Candidatus Roizmanbacteria bacterium]